MAEEREAARLADALGEPLVAELVREDPGAVDAAHERDVEERRERDEGGQPGDRASRDACGCAQSRLARARGVPSSGRRQTAASARMSAVTATQ